jgi:hypothetical protein
MKQQASQQARAGREMKLGPGSCPGLIGADSPFYYPEILEEGHLILHIPVIGALHVLHQKTASLQVCSPSACCQSGSPHRSQRILLQDGNSCVGYLVNTGGVCYEFEISLYIHIASG